MPATRTRWQDRPATNPQINFAADLWRGKDVPPAGRTVAEGILMDLAVKLMARQEVVTSGDASEVIDWLKSLPRKGATDEPQRGGKPEAGPGVYRKNGRIYVVKPTRATAKLPEEQQRCYAMELVELPGRARRLTASGDEIPFELQSRKGFVYELTEADRMPAADVEQIIIRYARCIICSHGLKDPKSVRRGIGPVCGKYIR